MSCPANPENVIKIHSSLIRSIADRQTNKPTKREVYITFHNFEPKTLRLNLQTSRQPYAAYNSSSIHPLYWHTFLSDFHTRKPSKVNCGRYVYKYGHLDRYHHLDKYCCLEKYQHIDWFLVILTSWFKFWPRCLIMSYFILIKYISILFHQHHSAHYIKTMNCSYLL